LLLFEEVTKVCINFHSFMNSPAVACPEWMRYWQFMARMCKLLIHHTNSCLWISSGNCRTFKWRTQSVLLCNTEHV